MTRSFLAALAGVLCMACGDTARLPFSAGTGPSPQLPEPVHRLIPTMHIAPAKGWPAGGKPVAAVRRRVHWVVPAGRGGRVSDENWR